jgi:hypothetical protein
VVLDSAAEEGFVAGGGAVEGVVVVARALVLLSTG